MIGGRGPLRLVPPPAGAFIALAGLGLAGVPLGSPAANGAACVAILLFGLPHGTLDLAILQQERALDRSAMRPLLASYIGLAGAMMLMWLTAPVAALIVFLAVSVIHFAEDWDDLRSSFLARAMASAILTAPALFHLPTLKALFVSLAGTPAAAVVGDLLLLLAPASLLIAVVALIALWHADRREQAITGGAVLAAMTLFPPLVAFAAFFCLFHSPLHLRESLVRLDRPAVARRLVPSLTLMAVGVACGLYAWGPQGEWSATLMAASFKTLSILTIPHMLIPAIATIMNEYQPTMYRRHRREARATT